MTFLNIDRIRDCLRELSDKDFQLRVWQASSGPEISSLTEATCQLFDDSGLDIAWEKGQVFESATDGMLKKLGHLLEEISDNRPPIDVINDPKMNEVRKLAGDILKRLASA